MNLPSLSDLAGLLSAWAQDTRLHALAATHAEQPLPADLMVERFELHEAVSQPFELCIHVLTLDTHVALKDLYARPVTLTTRLSDGSEVSRTGVVTEARSLQSDGGFARKALLLQPWIALLEHALCSRVWQDASVVQIVEDVFADHPQLAAWHWDTGVAEHVAQGLFARNGGQRSYCVQHRESDLDFVQRLLTEEGIAWRVEEHADAPMGHRVVFFVQSAQQPEDPTSVHSLGANRQGQGIRFHGHTSQEEQDSIIALAARRELRPTQLVLQGWDHKANQAIVAEVPTAAQWGPDEALTLNDWLHSYDPTGDFVCGNHAEATFLATLLQQAHEARHKTWFGRGSVRTLRAGTWAGVTQSTVGWMSSAGFADHAGEPHELFFTQVHAVGVNNLPKDIQALIDASLPHPKGRFARPRWPMLERPRGFDPEGGNSIHKELNTEPLHTHAERTGFACQFQAVRRDVPWRPVLMDDTGLRPRPRPTALGPQTAIVVGPDGSEHPSGAHELHTDKMGRVKVRFHWQSIDSPQRRASDHSCWLRVVQRLSGPGMGHQFIPRIGQEVLVTFLGRDIDRPVVMAALYNGQGESGIAPTPGGRAAEASLNALAQSTDHTPSSQGNLIGSGAGGHSPAWHGAASAAATPGAQGQANAAALSGIKSKEFGGSGHNQLVWDDTPEQLRTQLHTTQAQTWLQMGHLLHQADNHRGSFRGLGFELRSDAWGGVRAARGVMLSTFSLRNGLGQTAEPAGDNAAGIALARQMQQLAETFNQAATTHQTVGVATAAGSRAAKQSTLDDTLAPAAALTKSLMGTVSTTSLPNAIADAADKATGAATNKLPHMAAPNIALVGKAGIGITAGQDLHLSSQDTSQIASGQDSHWAVGGQVRVQTAQGIGVLAGAIQPGTEAAGKGITLIAAQGPIDLQAQAGPAQVAAKQTLELKTASGEVQIKAAKRVVMGVSGGASINIAGDGVQVVCPGKLTIRANIKSMVGPGTLALQLPSLPKSSITPRQMQLQLNLMGEPGAEGRSLANNPWRIVRDGGAQSDRLIAQGQTDAQGQIALSDMQQKRLSVALSRWPNDIWLLSPQGQRALSSESLGGKASVDPSQPDLSAMAALDFAPQPESSPHDPSARQARLQAARELGQPSSSPIHPRAKG
ncbi:type VI secretion system Vgr family protein [Aquabacterium parvum]|uniref:type VI secretion system Vgr family protein n=1 Tax=Aquabacterium parvum TaxID=70584 RepID=UPI000718BAC7|nr:type VI secretion system Vgr family protein [Aquabacterium parvum]